MLLKKIKIYAFTLVFLFASPSNKILPQVSVQALHIARSNPYTFVNADNTHLIYQDEIPVYKNPKYSVDERVEDLLSRMSLEEKIGQMNMPALFVKDLGESIEEKMEACKQFARGIYEEGIGPGGGFYCIPIKCFTMAHDNRQNI